jgi:hypothetical protein
MIAAHSARARPLRVARDDRATSWRPPRPVTRSRARTLRSVAEGATVFLSHCHEVLWILYAVAHVASVPAVRVPTRSGWTRALSELALARKHRPTESL